MEIKNIRSFDIQSFNAGYEKGRQVSTDIAYRAGYEAALAAVRERMKQVEQEYEDFLKEELGM